MRYVSQNEPKNLYWIYVFLAKDSIQLLIFLGHFLEHFQSTSNFYENVITFF